MMQYCPIAKLNSSALLFQQDNTCKTMKVTIFLGEVTLTIIAVEKIIYYKKFAIPTDN